ncbi:MAG: enoyl-CoA hydratase [Oscillospiraceae bacterium]|nr:enoyl-CoA hydratase [Oscillospiraceae bacterium]
MEKVFEKVKLECAADGVAYITLNDPANMNPVNAQTMGDLVDCLNYCEETGSVRVVVIRGAGGHFSAGGDVKGMKARMDQGINTTRSGIRIGGELIMRLKTISKPTIAWIEGAAAGVGMSIALACDFSIAAEDTKMVFAFVNIGFVPDGGITYMLSRAVGTTRATDLLMSGRRFTAAEAKSWGMITEAVPREELEATVQRYIKKYSAGPGVAYANIKALINRSCFSELNLCMQDEVAAQYACSTSQDHKEAVAAFVDKRKPAFTGK